MLRAVAANNNTNRSSSSNSSAPSKTWQAVDNITVQDVTAKALIYDLVQQQAAALEKTVPWFLTNMPASYFLQVPETIRRDHIKAISAVRDANLDLYLNLQNTVLRDGRQVLTFIRPGTEPGTLLRMVEELPAPAPAMPLSRLHVFSTADGTMSLNMFIYGTRPAHYTKEDLERSCQPILQYAKQVQSGQKSDELSPSDIFAKDALLDHMIQCTTSYLQIGCEDPVRFLRHAQLVHQVAGTDGTAIHITKNDSDGSSFWIDTAIGNSVPQVALADICRLLYVHHFDVSRSRLDIFPAHSTGTTTCGDHDHDYSVTLVRALVSPIPDAHTAASAESTLHWLADDLKRVKWLDPMTNDLVFDKYPSLGMARAEIITGLLAISHASLAKLNPTAYSSTSLYDKACRYINEATALADLLQDRFRPGRPLSDHDFHHRAAQIGQTIADDVEDLTAATILTKMLEVVKATLKTNLYMPERYALSFRLDPRCMETTTTTTNGNCSSSEPLLPVRELPYGLFFVHGCRFNGFHVRFRDIARGGMRLVTPATAEQHALESSRQYDECYGLAYAQQLKNKDIPEGGSKAVILIETTGGNGGGGERGGGLSPAQKHWIVRQSVKAMTDAILDLIVETDYTKQYLVDYWQKKEVLYLGPDEQVTPYDIEWIVARAAQRGYTTPAAFMSSKPKAGYVLVFVFCFVCFRLVGFWLLVLSCVMCHATNTSSVTFIVSTTRSLA
jgi:glutamate dehydrogenase